MSHKDIMVINSTTQKSYERFIERYKNLLEKEPGEIYESLIKDNISYGSIKNVICAFKWHTQNEDFGKIINILNEKIKEEKDDNTNKFKKIDLSEIKKPEGNDVNILIYSLYKYFPPRRVEDYAYMKYVLSDKNLSDEYNYYVNETESFIFNKYKTVKKFGRQEFKVPKELKKVIEEYVENMEIKDEYLLLQYNGKKNKVNEKSLRNRLNKIFGVSVDGIRHAYITELYQNPKNLLKIKDISAKMGHTISTHISYIDKEKF